MPPSRGTLMNQPSFHANMSDEDNNQTSLNAFGGGKPRKLNLPSETSDISKVVSDVANRYHDLGKLYPNAPVPSTVNGLVIHRATLHDLTGIYNLMDWLSDGEVVIVRMEKLLTRDLELQKAIEQLNQFILHDLGGQIIRLTDTRLMLLPPGCKGVKGLDSEAFAVEGSEFV